ncbi:MAG: tripartite tricarboxylate transporter permease [Candidatus Binatia bacterium]
MDNLNAFYIGLINILPFSEAGQDSFIFMLIGISIGFVVGLLPGLGGAVTLALMLPFIYNMTPTTAFAFLLGSNAVTATTGDITSVLFGVPGEGITAATIVDGHPMAKKGEAGRALGAALMSSLVGAVFGAFVLALAIPVVRPLVLAIGAGEFFMLAIVGITFVAALSGSNMIKGLIAGAFGLILAMVGLDPIESVPRFTMDSMLGEGGGLFLWDGVNIVAVTVGLFAIPEIIDLSVQGTSISKEGQPGKLGGVMEGVKDTFRHWKLVFRCSAIGAYIGLLPGLGGGPAQWISYAHAVQSSPDKESFGTGRIEGVLGPGAANNSKEGGALVPTIAFGVPGSVSMAILLGAFIIHGIIPGPDLLDPAVHLNLTFSFVWIIVVSNIITVAVCFLFLDQIAKITFVKGTYLVPFLLLLVFLGGFAVKNSFGDMVLVVLFGALGWFMVRYDWQRPPLLIGLVLGGIMENNFFIAYSIYGWSFLARPIVIFLILMTLSGLFYPSLKELWKKWKGGEVKKSAEETYRPSSEEDEGVVAGVTPYHALFALLLVAVFGYVMREAFFGFGDFDYEERTALFPKVIGIPGLIMALLVFVQELRKCILQPAGQASQVSESGFEPAEVRRRTISIVGWILGFFAFIWLLGFSLASVVGTILYLKVGSKERWPISIILTLVAGFFFAGVFEYALYLPFPNGMLFEWLGIEFSLINLI